MYLFPLIYLIAISICSAGTECTKVVISSDKTTITTEDSLIVTAIISNTCKKSRSLVYTDTNLGTRFTWYWRLDISNPDSLKMMTIRDRVCRFPTVPRNGYTMMHQGDSLVMRFPIPFKHLMLDPYRNENIEEKNRKSEPGKYAIQLLYKDKYRKGRRSVKAMKSNTIVINVVDK